MTPEEINKAIREACGWKKTQHGFWELRRMEPHGELLPDYLNDLNAMHEAEKTMSPHDRNDYIAELWRVTGNAPDSQNFWTEYNFRAFYACLHATAAQRAEALLRTIGKWTDQPKDQDDV